MHLELVDSLSKLLNHLSLFHSNPNPKRRERRYQSHYNNLMAEEEEEAVRDANVRTKVKDAIEQLLTVTERRRSKNIAQKKIIDDEEEDDKEEILLLSKLLSQVDALEKDNTPKPNDSPVEIKESDSVIIKSETNEEAECRSVGRSSGDTEIEEIVKEIKEVKKQNSVTHWLLSIMIILTATWQFSEVALVLNVKDKMSHPFRFVGNVLSSALTGGHANSLNGSARKEGTGVEHPFIPALKIPELPQMDLPVLGLNGAEHSNSQ